MADPLYQVVMTAAELKIAAPREFERFIEAMKFYEERCMADFAAAEAGGIFQAQGKYQAISQLRQKLETCHSLRATYEARK